MKSFFTLLALAVFAGSLHGQSFFNHNFSEFETIPCPYDSNTLITRPVGWLIYQTQDGRWDGPVDSSLCISGFAYDKFANCEIPLEQIDLKKPLFIRPDLDKYPFNSPHNYIFEPNSLYNAVVCANMYPFGIDSVWVLGGNCVQDVCSGVFIGLSIPDSNGVPGAAVREQTGLVDPNNDWPTFCAGMNTCFPTEYFTDQTLRHFVIKYTFPDTLQATGKMLGLYSAEIFNQWWVGRFSEISAGPQHFQSGQYFVPVQDVTSGYYENFLALYNETTYPSKPYPAFIDAELSPNNPQVQTINLVVDPYRTLEVQPFTYFRGGLAAGSDTLRHQFNLLNDGGDICLNFTDLVYGGGTAYLHRAGQIGMNNPFSCMQFREGSALKVLERGVLHYGNHGAGMLALCAGSKVVLEEGSTLVVDAVWNIAECDDNRPPEPYIDVELHHGARLSFTENAGLTNQFSQGQAMKLRIWMLGGTLDDSALSPDERALIERAWPTPDARLLKNLEVLGNDGSGNSLTIRYLGADHEKLTFSWYDTQGKLVRTESLSAERGYNVFQMEKPAHAGMYWLTVRNGGQTEVIKVARAE